MKKQYRSSGFSLVEVMIVAAALGGLALVGMQITKTQAKSAVKVAFDSEAYLIKNEMVAYLSDPVNCKATLISAGTMINPTTVGKFKTDGSSYGNGGIQITSFVYSSPASGPILTINFTNKNILKGTSGTSTVPKRINLYIDSPLTTCRSLSANAADLWTRGTGANSGDVFYSGNVGVGTTGPASKLDVAGTIRPGAVTLGGACSVLGSQGYNSVTGAPVYCNGLLWSAVGGFGTCTVVTSVNNAWSTTGGALNAIASCAAGDIRVGCSGQCETDVGQILSVSTAPSGGMSSCIQSCFFKNIANNETARIYAYCCH
jgi:prepilin-type N-terminal cleavage/methylation domain-containing protein